MSLVPVDDAIAAILQRVPAPTTEQVPLSEAAGRVLLEPVIATHDQPPFNSSAMDGYAMRAADVIEGHRLSVIGTAQAGAGFSGTVGAGQAVRIFTGAPVPDGADTVIMQEEAVVDADHVSFTAAARPGHSVRPLGNDFARGQVLVDAGTRLGPMQLAVAAAANCATLGVARRPSLALLATGDELVPPGQPLGPDQIVASNSFGLAPLLSPYAQTVADHGIVRDDRAQLRAKLTAIFAGEPDILITTGGASVGDHDIVQELLLELGVTLDFWRINMRPGKPLMFGTRGKTLVFGLPGNPVSAMVTAIVFIKPALRGWLGHTEPSTWRLPLAGPTPPNTARRHFMRARLLHAEAGPQILPITQTDSGHTSSMAGADMLIVQPEHDPGQHPGTIVEAIGIDAF
jgi:molybdopterin molybdotransferase